jgi:hypothetical protein
MYPLMQSKTGTQASTAPSALPPAGSHQAIGAHAFDSSAPWNVCAPTAQQADASALLSLLAGPQPADPSQLDALLQAANSHAQRGGGDASTAALVQLLASVAPHRAPQLPPLQPQWLHQPRAHGEARSAPLQQALGGIATPANAPPCMRTDLSTISNVSADTHLDSLTQSEMQVVHALHALSGSREPPPPAPVQTSIGRATTPDGESPTRSRKHLRSSPPLFDSPATSKRQRGSRDGSAQLSPSARSTPPPTAKHSASPASATAASAGAAGTDAGGQAPAGAHAATTNLLAWARFAALPTVAGRPKPPLPPLLREETPGAGAGSAPPPPPLPSRADEHEFLSSLPKTGPLAQLRHIALCERMPPESMNSTAREFAYSDPGGHSNHHSQMPSRSPCGTGFPGDHQPQSAYAPQKQPSPSPVQSLADLLAQHAGRGLMQGTANQQHAAHAAPPPAPGPQPGWDSALGAALSAGHTMPPPQQAQHQAGGNDAAATLLPQALALALASPEARMLCHLLAQMGSNSSAPQAPEPQHAHEAALAAPAEARRISTQGASTHAYAPATHSEGSRVLLETLLTQSLARGSASRRDSHASRGSVSAGITPTLPGTQ